MRAHTATHLLNWSLRQLTNDARQNGSKVGEDRLYFEVFTAVSSQFHKYTMESSLFVQNQIEILDYP